MGALCDYTQCFYHQDRKTQRNKETWCLGDLVVKSPAMTRFVYLHGFASGPESSKGQFFRARFAETGRSLELPDLTEGDFEHTSLTQQFRFLERLLGSDPAVLLGSSMGGYLAALAAARHSEQIPALVLLAPAFGLVRRWAESSEPEAMREWRQRGWRTVYHYGEQRERRLAYDLIADGVQYEDFPDVRQPALVIHGRRDEAVDYRLSERFSEARPNVELMLVDSDHQLLDTLDAMWERVSAFLHEQTQH